MFSANRIPATSRFLVHYRQDRRMNVVALVSDLEDGLFCESCNRGDCEHIPPVLGILAEDWEMELA